MVINGQIANNISKNGVMDRITADLKHLINIVEEILQEE